MKLLIYLIIYYFIFGTFILTIIELNSKFKLKIKYNENEIKGNYEIFLKIIFYFCWIVTVPKIIRNYYKNR